MDTIILTIIATFLIGIIITVITLLLIRRSRKNGLKQNIEKLEYEKNLIDGTMIISELSKIEAFLNSEKMQNKYQEWRMRLDIIKTTQVPVLTDMILDTEYSLTKLNYKNTLHKLAKLELELYKVRANSELLLKEIKAITTSDEKNRAIITTLKLKYRELFKKFSEGKKDYGDVSKSIALQFENIALRFDDFERAMELNEYGDVNQVIKAIDDMLKHMDVVIEEMPSILLLANNLIVKKMQEVSDTYTQMINEGYPLDYLNIEYNVTETENKIHDILDRANVLNLEDSLFELKLMLEYFDGIFTDFENEKSNRHVYEETTKVFELKLNKINKLISDMYLQIDDIKNLYHLSENDVRVLAEVSEAVQVLNNDYKVFIDHTQNGSFAYSKLNKEIEGLMGKLTSIEDHLNNSLEALGSMKEDEIRARQQLEEIKQIFKDSKNKIREYPLPVIPKNYYTELNEAQDAIREIAKELDRTPITISILNTRVDTARDLVLKLFSNTKSMLKTAMFAEMAIVYGNRYRTGIEDLDHSLSHSEGLFYKGDYQKSLEFTISAINKVEPGIYDKLLVIYSSEK